MQEEQNALANAEKGETLIDTIADGVLALDGIPLPPSVKKSFWKSIGMLITGMADVPAAKLESIARNLRTEGQAKDAVTIAAAKAAAKQFNESPELADRAVNHFAARIVREQGNREDIAKLAVKDILKSPPTGDTSTTVEDDWLAMFAEIAQKKSNTEMQLYLSKILAGEIRQPGSFSPATINALATLSQPLANSFQKVCDLSMQLFDSAFILTSPYPSFASHGIPAFGITYKNLIDLQDHGLLASELKSTYDLNPMIGKVPFDYCGQQIIFNGIDNKPQKLATASISLFSQVGLELRGIISMKQNLQHTHNIQGWLRKANISMLNAT